MQSNNRSWPVPLLVFVWIITVVILAPANCRHNTTKENPLPTVADKKAKTHTGSRDEKRKKESSKEYVLNRSTCAEDDDCPSDSSCKNSTCIITVPTDNDDDEDEFDTEDGQEIAHSCETATDCGCGYNCVNGECQKSDSVCCANADCNEGDFCHFGEDGNDPNGTCMLSECDTSGDCGQCGMQCNHHLCDQKYCCTDKDCPTGKLCGIFEYQTEGFCVVPECKSDDDCGCGHICDVTRYACNKYSPNRPMQCCDTDFYYGGQCFPHEYIENGSCLDDTHCPIGKVCSDQEICVPETCTQNSDCGCEFVCRKGHCEMGCDTNKDCCIPEDGSTCDRGECVDLNAEDDEEEE